MPATAWIFTDGDRHAALLCRSVRPPDDRWLSIAESFEFLPAEEWADGCGPVVAGRARHAAGPSSP